ALLGVGLYLVLTGLGLWNPATSQVQDVPDGDQEIAWIQPASSISDWGLFVARVELLVQSPPAGWPTLRIDRTNAFPERTSAVPEIALWFEGQPHKLWIRWYKLSSETGVKEWLTALARRPTPPLAVMGGESSSTALDLARTLQEKQEQWRRPAPLLLITQATAVNVPGPERGQELIKVYPERSIRSC